MWRVLFRNVAGVGVGMQPKSLQISIDGLLDFKLIFANGSVMLVVYLVLLGSSRAILALLLVN